MKVLVAFFEKMEYMHIRGGQNSAIDSAGFRRKYSKMHVFLQELEGKMERTN